MATHSSILTQKIPWTEVLAGYSLSSCKEDSNFYTVPDTVLGKTFPGETHGKKEDSLEKAGPGYSWKPCYLATEQISLRYYFVPEMILDIGCKLVKKNTTGWSPTFAKITV